MPVQPSQVSNRFSSLSPKSSVLASSANPGLLVSFGCGGSSASDDTYQAQAAFPSLAFGAENKKKRGSALDWLLDRLPGGKQPAAATALEKRLPTTWEGLHTELLRISTEMAILQAQTGAEDNVYMSGNPIYASLQSRALRILNRGYAQFGEAFSDEVRQRNGIAEAQRQREQSGPRQRHSQPKPAASIEVKAPFPSTEEGFHRELVNNAIKMNIIKAQRGTPDNARTTDPTYLAFELRNLLLLSQGRLHYGQAFIDEVAKRYRQSLER